MAASRLCRRAALVALCVARVSGAFPAGHATCCSEEKKCCGQTFPPPKSHACAEGHRCCVGDCDAVSLETVVVPPPVSRARNAYGLRISADCCDVFHADGRVCRPDYGDDCSAARRCRAFTSDCGTCDTYCSRLDDA